MLCDPLTCGLDWLRAGILADEEENPGRAILLRTILTLREREKRRSIVRPADGDLGSLYYHLGYLIGHTAEPAKKHALDALSLVDRLALPRNAPVPS
jgi:hypothetical protein